MIDNDYLINQFCESMPDVVADQLVFLTVSGSRAYGTARDDSDYDLVGVYIPYMKDLFPWKYGYAPEFYVPDPNQRVIYQSKLENMDCTAYSVAKFFSLLAQGNPNIVSVMFGPKESELYIDQSFVEALDMRKMFLSQRIVPRFIGYAASMMCKAYKPVRESRQKFLSQDGKYECKFMVNLVRLGLECEQLLMNQTLDYPAMAHILKSILGGTYPRSWFDEWFEFQKERIGALVYTLPENPDYEKLTVLLWHVYEEFLGPLDVNVGLAEERSGWYEAYYK